MGRIGINGELRCDAKGTGYATLTTAALYRRWVEEAGGTVNDAAMTALDAAAPYLIGYYTGTEPVNRLTAFDDLFKGIVGWWSVNDDAEFTAGVIAAPAATAPPELTDLTILDFRLLTLVPPAWRIRVEYARNWRPQSQFFETVTEEDQLALSETGIIAEAFEDETIKTAEPRAVDVPVIRSLVLTEADAIDIRDRAAAAWGVARRIYEIQARIDAPGLYDTVDVDYMMVDGSFRVHSSVRSFGGGATTLQLWG